MKKPHEDVADGGWGWLVLFGAFMGQFLVAGACFNLGVYVVEWQPYFNVGAAPVSVIVTVVLVAFNIIGVFVGAFCKHYGCRSVMMVGGLIGAVSTFCASFATQLWHLYLCFAFAGIGHGTAYIPTLLVIRYYFKKRLGLANGITYAGIGAGLLVMAPAMERACSVYGWKGALLIHSAINANVIVCGALFRPSKLEKQMLEQSRMKTTSKSEDDPKSKRRERASCCLKLFRKADEMFALSKLVQNRLFIAFTLISIFTLCGYVSSLLFLTPKLVYDLEFTKLTASLITSTFGICNLLARIFHGFLLDYKVISVVNLYLVSLFVCGINPIFNALVSTESGQYILAAIFGLGAGVFNAMNAQVVREIVPIDLVSNAMGLVITFATAGQMLGTQLMGKLFDVTGSYDIPFYINGALLWTGALLMGFLTKFSRWKDWKPDIAEATLSNGEIVLGDEMLTSDSRESKKEPASTRYQPVPTDQSGIQLDSSI